MSGGFVTKEQAACCTSRRDDLGRLPIGFCSPDCERRDRPAVYDYRWALDHDRCRTCGQVDQPHVGNGQCRRCDGRARAEAFMAESA